MDAAGLGRAVNIPGDHQQLLSQLTTSAVAAQRRRSKRSLLSGPVLDEGDTADGLAIVDDQDFLSQLKAATEGGRESKVGDSRRRSNSASSARRGRRRSSNLGWGSKSSFSTYRRKTSWVYEPPVQHRRCSKFTHSEIINLGPVSVRRYTHHGGSLEEENEEEGPLTSEPPSRSRSNHESSHCSTRSPSRSPSRPGSHSSSRPSSRGPSRRGSRNAFMHPINNRIGKRHSFTIIRGTCKQEYKISKRSSKQNRYSTLSDSQYSDRRGSTATGPSCIQNLKEIYNTGSTRGHASSSTSSSPGGQNRRWSFGCVNYSGPGGLRSSEKQQSSPFSKSTSAPKGTESPKSRSRTGSNASTRPRTGNTGRSRCGSGSRSRCGSASRPRCGSASRPRCGSGTKERIRQLKASQINPVTNKETWESTRYDYSRDYFKDGIAKVEAYLKLNTGCAKTSQMTEEQKMKENFILYGITPNDSEVPVNKYGRDSGFSSSPQSPKKSRLFMLRSQSANGSAFNFARSMSNETKKQLGSSNLLVPILEEPIRAPISQPAATNTDTVIDLPYNKGVGGGRSQGRARSVSNPNPLKFPSPRRLSPVRPRCSQKEEISRANERVQERVFGRMYDYLSRQHNRLTTAEIIAEVTDPSLPVPFTDYEAKCLTSQLVEGKPITRKEFFTMCSTGVMGLSEVPQQVRESLDIQRKRSEYNCSPIEGGSPSYINMRCSPEPPNLEFRHLEQTLQTKNPPSWARSLSLGLPSVDEAEKFDPHDCEDKFNLNFLSELDNEILDEWVDLLEDLPEEDEEEEEEQEEEDSDKGDVLVGNYDNYNDGSYYQYDADDDGVLYVVRQSSWTSSLGRDSISSDVKLTVPMDL